MDKISIIFQKSDGESHIERVDRPTASKIFRGNADSLIELFRKRFGEFEPGSLLQFQDLAGQWKAVSSLANPSVDINSQLQSSDKINFRLDKGSVPPSSGANPFVASAFGSSPASAAANRVPAAQPAPPGISTFAGSNGHGNSGSGLGWGSGSGSSSFGAADSGKLVESGFGQNWNTNSSFDNPVASQQGFSSGGGGGWGIAAESSTGGGNSGFGVESGWNSGAAVASGASSGGWNAGNYDDNGYAAENDYSAQGGENEDYGRDNNGFDSGRKFSSREPRERRNEGSYRGDEGGAYRPRERFNRDQDENGGFGGGRRNRDGEGGFDGDRGGYKPRERFNRDQDENGGFGGGRRERGEEGDGSGGHEIFGRRKFDRDAEETGPVRSRPSDADVVMSRSEAPRSGAFTEEKDLELEKDLFEMKIGEGINFSKYSNIQVKIHGQNAPAPLKSFEESGLLPHIMYNIKLSGYTVPTPVQKYTIPGLMRGHDLMACAQTGSGKTAAFLLPIVSSLLQSENIHNRSVGRTPKPLALIMAPTRELSAQIFDEARKFTYRTGIRPCVVYGGANFVSQLHDMRRGCEILIATPGRLYDFVDKGELDLSEVRYMVFDEADRMLDMGFSKQINAIMESCDVPPCDSRQTAMFSATFPREIREMARRFLKESHLFLEVGRVGGACENIEQVVMEVAGRRKRDELKRLLAETGRSRVLIFTNTKSQADMIDDFLFDSGFPATSIHGDRNQQQRESALNSFKRGKTPILVATDVAARGLDIPDISLVVLYDMSKTIDDYIHRIGRTARAGHLGKAVTFYDSSKDSSLSGELVRILEESNQHVPEFLRSAPGDFGY